MLATAGDCVKLWNTTDFSLQHSPAESHSAGVEHLSWNSDGNCMATVSQGSHQVALAAVKGTSILELPSVKGLSGVVSGISFANKGSQYLAVAESSGQVLVWDVKQHARKKTYMTKSGNVTSHLTCVVFSPNDSHIAVGTRSGAALLLSVTNNTVSHPHQLFQNKSRVTCLSYSSVRRGILGAASETGAVCYLDVNSGKASQFTVTHAAPCNSIAFSPINELLLVSAGCDKKMVCYNVNTLKPAQIINTDSPLSQVTFLHGGLQLVAGTLNGEVLVHDLRSLRSPLHRFHAHATHLTVLALQPQHNKQIGSSTKKRMNSCPKIAVLAAASPALVSSISKTVTPSLQHCTAGTGISVNSVMSSDQLLDTSELLSPVRDTELLSPLKITALPNQRNMDNLSLNFATPRGRPPHHVARSDGDYEDAILSPLKSHTEVTSQSPYIQSAVAQTPATHVSTAPRTPAATTTLIRQQQHSDYEDEFLSPVRDGSSTGVYRPDCATPGALQQPNAEVHVTVGHANRDPIKPPTLEESKSPTSVSRSLYRNVTENSSYILGDLPNDIVQSELNQTTKCDQQLSSNDVVCNTNKNRKILSPHFDYVSNNKENIPSLSIDAAGESTNTDINIGAASSTGDGLKFGTKSPQRSQKKKRK